MSRPSELSARLLEAFQHRDWDLLATLYHPDALLPTVAGKGETLRPDELIVVLRSAVADPFYEVEPGVLVDLDDRACLVSGRIRHRLDGGGMADHDMHWVHVFKDGLLWRSGAYSSAQKARAAFRAGGYTLGIAEAHAPGRALAVLEP